MIYQKLDFGKLEVETSALDKVAIKKFGKRWDETTEDEKFEIDGVACIMEKSHSIYLMGMEVDWQGGLNSRGFTFTNPNASKTCGCGTSFAV